MIRRLALALCLMMSCLGARGLHAQDSLAVLFIGNSHTYVNDLPSMVRDLAASGGQPMVVDRSAIGGYTLWQHRTNSATLAKLAQRHWDVVVLQEQSQIPVIPWCRDNLMYPAAMGLDSLIRAQGSQTLLYMTWGWNRLDESQCYQDSCSIAFRDFFHMQDSLAVGYLRLGQLLDCAVAPVGEVWRRVALADPFAPLWAPDDYHPALEGSYLGACTFYHELFGQSPVGLSYTAGLDSTRVRWLQEQVEAELDLAPPLGPRSPEPAILTHWPNPFNGQCTLNFTLPRAGQASLRVLDLRGALVHQAELGRLGAGSHRRRLALEQAATGLYLLELSLDGRILQRQRSLLVR